MAGAYWLDSNVFIDAKNGLFAFDLAPRFWVWLDGNLKSGILRSTVMVYKEIVSSESQKDDLHRWAKARRKNGYWTEPNEEVQEIYGRIAVHVQNHYGQSSPAKTQDFLAKADGWVIAHAMHDGGTVVTLEARVSQGCQVPKIPNVCSHFNVPCISTTDMLRRLGFKLK